MSPWHSQRSAWFGRGDDTIGTPHGAQNFSIRAFRACPLVEIRQALACRAIRGNSISVNSTLPPLSSACAEVLSQWAALKKYNLNSLTTPDAHSQQRETPHTT